MNCDLYDVVRIDPHPTQSDACTIGFRAERQLSSPEAAQRYATDLSVSDARAARSVGLYVVVQAGGDPLRDPSCLALFTHPGADLALPF